MYKNRKYPNALFVVRVAGDLAYKDGDQEKSKPYDETVIMDADQVFSKEENAVSSFVKYYVPDLFASAHTPDGKPNPKRVTGFIRVLTHQLVSCKYKDNPERPVGIVQLMNRQDLLKYIEVENYDIDVELYPDDLQLQQAVLDIEDDEDAFKKSQELRRQTQGSNIAKANKAKKMMAIQSEDESTSENEETEEIEEDVDDDDDPVTPPVKQKRRVAKRK